MTGEDANLPTSIRSLDPVDPSAPPPDGSRLLQSVLATPRSNRRRRVRVRLLHLVPAGLGLALVAGVATMAISVAGNGGRGDEKEATSGLGGAGIIHYVVRESYASPDGSWAPVATSETWQLEDGSRARTVALGGGRPATGDDVGGRRDEHAVARVPAGDPGAVREDHPLPRERRLRRHPRRAAAVRRAADRRVSGGGRPSHHPGSPRRGRQRMSRSSPTRRCTASW